MCHVRSGGVVVVGSCDGTLEITQPGVVRSPCTPLPPPVHVHDITDLCQAHNVEQDPEPMCGMAL